MHEVGIMQSILATVEHQARTSQAAQIHAIRMRVGTLSGLVIDSLQCAFEVMREGTMAAGATLQVEEVRPVFWCEPCQQEFEVPEMFGPCPKCGAPSADLRRGRELELISMEIS
jgi:hydrogenase nickel incorporation protein HypA/HybF